MKRFYQAIIASEFHLFLYAFACLLFNWPLLSIINNTEHAFISLFILWFLLIVLLFFMSKAPPCE